MATSKKSEKAVLEFIAGLKLEGADLFTKEMRDLAKKTSANFGETMGDALKSGLSAKNLRGIVNTFSLMAKKIEDAQIKGASEASRIQLASLQKQFKIEQEQVRKISKRRMDALAQAKKFMEGGKAGLVEDLASSISEAISGLQGGNLTGGAWKGAGRGLQGLGGMALKKGSDGNGGLGSKTMLGIGKFLSRIGPTLLAVGALVGAIGLFVKMITDADSRMTELNKTLLDGGVAGAELADMYGMVGDNLNKVRKTFTTGKGAFSFNVLWGTTAKDHLEILAAYSEAGLTFKELIKGAKDMGQEMAKLRDATATALTYSKLLGVSSQDMAGGMASWMEDLGMSIQGVSEGLSGVTMAASESGFGVKRFFGMVLQATSGMSMYNVRLEEAGGLLIRLGKILGVKTGGDFLQQLTKGFSSEGMQERYKRVMITPGMQGIFDRTSKNTSQDFLGKLGGLQGRPAEVLNKALDEAGVKSRDTAGFTKELGSLDNNTFVKMLAQARTSGADDLVRVLEGVRAAAQGARGGTGNMAFNLDSLDMGGKLMALLNQAQVVLGEPLHKIKDPARVMAYEAMTGVSGEQRKQLESISRAVHGAWDQLRASQDKVLTAQEQKEQAEALGATVENGIIRTARVEKDGTVTLGSKLDSLGDYIQTQGDVFKQAAADGVPVDIQLAQDIAANTTEMTKILEQGVEYWLEQIHGVAETILNIFQNKDEAIEKQKALVVLRDEMKLKREGIRSKEGEIARLQAEIKTESTMEGKSRIREQVGVLRKNIERDQEGYKQLSAKRSNLLQDPTRVGWFFEKTRNQEQLLHEAGEGGNVKAIQQDALSRMDPEVRKKAEANIRELFVQRTLENTFGVKTKAEWIKKYSTMDPKTREMPLGLLSLGNASDEQLGGDAWEIMKAEASRKAGAVANAVLTGSAQTVGDESIFKEKWFGGSSGVKYLGAESGARFKIEQQAVDALAKAAQSDFAPILEQNAKDQVEAEKQNSEKLHGPGGKAPKAAADEIRKAVEKMRDEDLALKLKAVLEDSGTQITKNSALEMAQQLRATGELPDTLREKLDQASGSGTVRSRLSDWGIPANDFLAHIGKDGQLKFGQRINSQDDVTVAAHRAGGPLRRGGGSQGNINITYHEYMSPHGWTQNQSKMKRILAGRV